MVIVDDSAIGRVEVSEPILLVGLGFDSPDDGGTVDCLTFKKIYYNYSS